LSLYGSHIATDISGNNIAFTCRRWRKDLFKRLGAPKVERLIRTDGKPLGKGLPKYLVKAIEWDYWADECIEDLRIIDLGESFLQGAEPPSLAQPRPLKVPETIFADSFDHRVDLWRAGCVVSCPTHVAEG
jgi:serine/threonine-protein kinase SRPK3